jgi:hypothetical protein
VDPLPVAGVQAVLDGASSESGFDSLLTAEETELPRRQATELSFFVW